MRQDIIASRGDFLSPISWFSMKKLPVLSSISISLCIREQTHGLQVRGVEVGIVVLVLIFWAGAIALFFNRWGKIRMLLPYQPDYKEQLKVPGTGVCAAANAAYTQHPTQHNCSQVTHYHTGLFATFSILSLAKCKRITLIYDLLDELAYAGSLKTFSKLIKD